MRSFLLSCLLVLPAFARVEIAPCKNNVPPEQQIELGNKAAAQVYKEMPVLPDSSPITQYVSKLGQRLAAQAPGYKWPYNFHVVNVADINAFALPGGSAFVNLGTIQAAQNEAQLAGVMAHEISHVVLQHSVCNAVKQQRVGILAGIGQIAANIALGGAAGQLASQGIGITAGLGFLKMSRGAEKEADLEGVGILYDAGYDPKAMAQFFEILQSKVGNGPSQFLSDHPNPGNRTEYIDQEVAGFVPKPNYITSSPGFTAVQKMVNGMHVYTGKEVAAGAWKHDGNVQAPPAGAQGQNSVSAQPVNLKQIGSLRPYSGQGFQISYPDNWQVSQNGNNFTVIPPGGSAGSSVTYGLLSDVFQSQGGDSTKALIDGLARDNPGLRAGAINNITVSGQPAQSVDCENPSANNGAGEHDWIVTVPSGNAVRYFVFIAPSADFERLRPTFNSMLKTLRVSQ